MFEPILSFIVNWFVAFLFGIVGAWFYNVIYFWNLRLIAPSARSVRNIITLSQEDYDALPEKKESLVYMTTKENSPSDLGRWERVRRILFPGS